MFLHIHQLVKKLRPQNFIPHPALYPLSPDYSSCVTVQHFIKQLSQEMNTFSKKKQNEIESSMKAVARTWCGVVAQVKVNASCVNVVRRFDDVILGEQLGHLDLTSRHLLVLLRHWPLSLRGSTRGHLTLFLEKNTIIELISLRLVHTERLLLRCKTSKQMCSSLLT